MSKGHLHSKAAGKVLVTTVPAGESGASRGGLYSHGRSRVRSSNNLLCGLILCPRSWICCVCFKQTVSLSVLCPSGDFPTHQPAMWTLRRWQEEAWRGQQTHGLGRPRVGPKATASWAAPADSLAHHCPPNAWWMPVLPRGRFVSSQGQQGPGGYCGVVGWPLTPLFCRGGAALGRSHLGPGDVTVRAEAPASRPRSPAGGALGEESEGTHGRGGGPVLMTPPASVRSGGQRPKEGETAQLLALSQRAPRCRRRP